MEIKTYDWGFGQIRQQAHGDQDPWLGDGQVLYLRPGDGQIQHKAHGDQDLWQGDGQDLRKTHGGREMDKSYREPMRIKTYGWDGQDLGKTHGHAGTMARRRANRTKTPRRFKTNGWEMDKTYDRQEAHQDLSTPMAARKGKAYREQDAWLGDGQDLRSNQCWEGTRQTLRGAHGDQGLCAIYLAEHYYHVAAAETKAYNEAERDQNLQRANGQDLTGPSRSRPTARTCWSTTTTWLWRPSPLRWTVVIKIYSWETDKSYMAVEPRPLS
eukprot:s573_g30.t1